MFPVQEIRGQEDDPAARLCPLGWTAIGRRKIDTPERNSMCQHWLPPHILVTNIVSGHCGHC